jgi:hypothetical protein
MPQIDNITQFTEVHTRGGIMRAGDFRIQRAAGLLANDEHPALFVVQQDGPAVFPLSSVSMLVRKET